MKKTFKNRSHAEKCVENFKKYLGKGLKSIKTDYHAWYVVYFEIDQGYDTEEIELEILNYEVRFS